MSSSLEDYYKTIHLLKHNHNYSLSELNEFMPWERDSFIALLANSLAKEVETLSNN